MESLKKGNIIYGSSLGACLAAAAKPHTVPTKKYESLSLSISLFLRRRSREEEQFPKQAPLENTHTRRRRKCVWETRGGGCILFWSENRVGKGRKWQKKCVFRRPRASAGNSFLYFRDRLFALVHPSFSQKCVKNSSSFSRRFKSKLHFYPRLWVQFISLKVEQRGKYFFRISSFEKLGTLCAASLDRNINWHQRRENEKIYPGIKRPYVRNNPLPCCPFKSPLLICQCWTKEKRREKGVLISSNLRQIGARRNGKYYFFRGKTTESLYGN